MLNCIVVGLGGFIGSVLRYLLSKVPLKVSEVLPLNTFIINILGALLIGVIMGLATKNNTFNDKLLLFLKIGICGGFTTFSTFSYEMLEVLQEGKIVLGILYAVVSVVGCVLAAYFGQELVR